jgi:hypothetical protein
MHDLEFIWYTRKQDEEFDHALFASCMNMCQIGNVYYWKELASDMLCGYKYEHGMISHVLSVFLNDSIVGFVFIRNGKKCIEPQQSNKRKRTRIPICMLEQQHAWYLELICTMKGYGKPTLRHVHNTAKHERIQIITLASIPNRIIWYYSQGFRLTLTQTESKDITKDMKILQEKNVSFNDIEDVLQDDDMIRLLKKASENYLVTSNERSLANSIIDGVYMTLFI